MMATVSLACRLLLVLYGTSIWVVLCDAADGSRNPALSCGVLDARGRLRLVTGDADKQVCLGVDKSIDVIRIGPCGGGDSSDVWTLSYKGGGRFQVKLKDTNRCLRLTLSSVGVEPCGAVRRGTVFRVTRALRLESVEGRFILAGACYVRSGVFDWDEAYKRVKNCCLAFTLRDQFSLDNTFTVYTSYPDSPFGAHLTAAGVAVAPMPYFSAMASAISYPNGSMMLRYVTGERREVAAPFCRPHLAAALSIACLRHPAPMPHLDRPAWDDETTDSRAPGRRTAALPGDILALLLLLLRMVAVAGAALI